MQDDSRGSSLSRRRVLAGAASAAGVWATPSVLKFDRVAAATGSCGVAPVQVDWSNFAPTTTMPASVVANDGTVVSFALSGSTSLLAAGYAGNILAATRGALTDYLALGLQNARNGAGIRLDIRLSAPRQICFTMTDVDRASGAWEDSVAVRAWLGGANVPINVGDLILQGPSVINIPINTVRGVASEGNSSSLANVDFSAPQEVDRVQLRYYDATSWTNLQVIGIHDLRWC